MSYSSIAHETNESPVGPPWALAAAGATTGLGARGAPLVTGRRGG